jgi:invasion protein IalB
MNQMIERLVVGGVALVAGLVIGWAGHGVTGYNIASENVTNYQDWRLACPPANLANQYCELVEDVLDSKTRSGVARFAIAKDNGKPVIGITLPLDVALEPGMGLALGSDPVKVIPYRTCNAVGCIAEVALDDKLQASLDSGKDGRVLFAGLDNKPVAVPLSMKGFADAQKAYRSAEAKRSSWFWRMW